MFTLVALDGPRAGQVARGTLALVPTDTVHRLYDTRFGAPRRRRDERPLRGWAEVRGEVGLETAGTPLDSRDPALPGVVSILDSAQSRLTIRLGDRLMFDGGFNELTVTEAGDDGFVGQWRSSLGYTNYHASGDFCARRTGGGSRGRTPHAHRGGRARAELVEQVKRIR
ncbi:MAG: hypothetical protein ACYC1S_15560 [Gemmatimonadaceae bacterium]